MKTPEPEYTCTLVKPTCWKPNCKAKAVASGLCWKHYLKEDDRQNARRRRGLTLIRDIRRKQREQRDAFSAIIRRIKLDPSPPPVLE